MKTTLACLALGLVLTFNGQLVSAQEEPPATNEGDPPVQAADDSRLAASVSNLAASFPEAKGYGSIYGEYDAKECCWENGPKAPKLNVGGQCQSESVRRKIEYMLSQNPAVEQAISKNSMNCERNNWGSEGLSDNCPSKYRLATEVELYGKDKKCYIVRPHKQCVTYKECYPNSNCAGGGGGKRSVMHDLITRSIGSGDPCYGRVLTSSICLPDGHRTFKVWIYCDYYGFRLINMELPQCCSCKRYKVCYSK